MKSAATEEKNDDIDDFEDPMDLQREAKVRFRKHVGNEEMF